MLCFLFSYGPFEISASCLISIVNRLQVLDTAELAQIYQRIRHQLHPVVPLLDAFKAEQQPLELGPVARKLRPDLIGNITIHSSFPFHI